MTVKENAITSDNGLPILRAMGAPILFDGGVNNLNLGVAGKWVTLFDLRALTDRVFIGLQLFNPSAGQKIYLAFEQVTGSEVKSLIVELSSEISLDELTFGPGHRDKWTMKYCNFVRAMVAGAVGLPPVGTATYSVNIAAGKQFTIGTNVYTFYAVSAPSSDPNGIAIGTTLALTLQNALAVINKIDSNVTATASSTVLTVTSNWAGLGMNSYVFVDGGVAGANTTGGTFTGSGTLGGSGASQVGTAGVSIDAQIW